MPTLLQTEYICRIGEFMYFSIMGPSMQLPSHMASSIKHLWILPFWRSFSAFMQFFGPFVAMH